MNSDFAAIFVLASNYPVMSQWVDDGLPVSSLVIKLSSYVLGGGDSSKGGYGRVDERHIVDESAGVDTFDNLVFTLNFFPFPLIPN